MNGNGDCGVVCVCGVACKARGSQLRVHFKVCRGEETGRSTPGRWWWWVVAQLHQKHAFDSAAAAVQDDEWWCSGVSVLWGVTSLDDLGL